MDQLIQAVASGLLAGTTYSILALGLVLLFRATQVFNFAHGHFALAGAYVAAWLQTLGPFAGSPFGQLGAICMSVLMVAAVSGLMYRLVLHRLTGMDHWLAVFATFGAAAVLEAGLTIAFSGRDLILSIPALPSGGVSIFNARLGAAALVLAAGSLLVFMVAGWFMHGTAMGQKMAAAGQNPLLSSLSGIAIHRSNTAAWSLGGGLAALAGVSFGAANVVSPAMAHLGMLAFPALLLGGMDSIAGALVGGLLVGVIHGLVAAYVDGGAVSMAVYALLLVMLLFRPQGLFGTREVKRV